MPAYKNLRIKLQNCKSKENRVTGCSEQGSVSQQGNVQEVLGLLVLDVERILMEGRNRRVKITLVD